MGLTEKGCKIGYFYTARLYFVCFQGIMFQFVRPFTNQYVLFIYVLLFEQLKWKYFYA